MFKHCFSRKRHLSHAVKYDVTLRYLSIWTPFPCKMRSTKSCNICDPGYLNSKKKDFDMRLL
jgi:hypothetical protein